MLTGAGTDTPGSISEAKIVEEKQGPGDRHPEPGAGGEDTNRSEKDKQENYSSQLPGACDEGEGNGCSLQDRRQLLIAPPSRALWVPPKSRHRSTQKYTSHYRS